MRYKRCGSGSGTGSGKKKSNDTKDEYFSHQMRTQSLNVFPLKPGVGRYIAINATLAAMDFFLAYFYPSGPFTCIFPNLSRFLLC